MAMHCWPTRPKFTQSSKRSFRRPRGSKTNLTTFTKPIEDSNSSPRPGSVDQDTLTRLELGGSSQNWLESSKTFSPIELHISLFSFHQSEPVFGEIINTLPLSGALFFFFILSVLLLLRWNRNLPELFKLK